MAVRQLKLFVVSAALPTAFSEFWKLYPKKMGRMVAQVSFNKLAMADQLLAIQAVPAHILYWQQLGTTMQYIPLPSTWLNQHRFEDELVGQLPDVLMCFWKGCSKTGAYPHGSGMYCETHLAALKRGESA